MTQAEHILALIKECDKNGYSESEKEKVLKEFLKPDFIPKNSKGCKLNSDKPINITRALPGMRCVQQISYDPQSGPIYCGDPAYLYGEGEKNKDLFFIFCKDCAKRHNLSLENNN